MAPQSIEASEKKLASRASPYKAITHWLSYLFMTARKRKRTHSLKWLLFAIFIAVVGGVVLILTAHQYGVVKP